MRPEAPSVRPIRMRTPTPTRLLVVSLVAVALAAGAFVARPYALPNTPALPGLRVDGVEIPRGSDGAAEVRARKAALEGRGSSTAPPRACRCPSIAATR